MDLPPPADRQTAVVQAVFSFPKHESQFSMKQIGLWKKEFHPNPITGEEEVPAEDN